MTLVNIADLRDPNDPQGRTYRQVNAAKTHSIPIGTLVEIVGDHDMYVGVRLFVVAHHRDCDQTPLYGLSWNREIQLYSDETKRFWSGKVLHGISEPTLRVVRTDS